MLLAIYPQDANDLVRQLQVALNQQLRLHLPLDGVAGPATVAAVQAFQRQNNLTADGVAGPKTLAALRLTFTHPKVGLADYRQAAAALGVSVAHVRTVCEVEDRGSGFLDDGRPKILFERHQFYKHLVSDLPKKDTAQAMARRAEFSAQNPDICSAIPGGYKGGAAEWDRLSRAMVFNETAALEATSFGLFQVMGFNAVEIGYPSVQVFARAMMGSEGDHLQAFVRFLKNDLPLLMALKRGDWASFAAGYNGPDYAKNKYDSKLATAFAKFQGMPS